MNKLTQGNNGYFINSKKSFQSGNTFRDDTIDKVFEFAYAMTFGDGEHRDHRTGGTMNRKKGQIFINTFQSKLSELSVYNIFSQSNKEAYSKLSKPDFDVYGLGEWDDSDIELDKIKFSVKSTKFYGNLLLLGTKDWSEKREYFPNLNISKNCIYDYFTLVRIKPDGEKWEYNVLEYITNEDLKYLISNDFILSLSSL